MKKILFVVVALVMALCAFPMTGCNGNKDGEEGGTEYTGNETELRVGVWDGGLGHEWLNKVKTEFEKKYADVSFQEGRTGVRVKLNPSKTNMLGEKVESAIDLNQDAEDIYFTCYFTGTPYIFQNRSLNITDAVEQKVYLANGELADMEWDAESGKLKLKDGAEAPTKSIADKMTDDNRTGYYTSAETLAGSDHEEGYYALPFENSLSGFIYDHDLFENEGWLDYDGIDGLPDTMDDFFDLLDRICDADMIPFTFSRIVSYYWGGICDAFLAQYEGHENAELDYTLNGTYTFPANTFDSGTVTEENITVNADGTQTVAITRDNGWMLAHTPGKAELIKFMRRLCTPKYYDQKIYDSLYDENYKLPAQNFILSSLGKKGQRRIAMLYEGEWWENENRTQFNYTGGYGTRDFRFFPLPYIDGQKDPDQRTVADYSRGVDLFVNAKTQKAALSKLFLQFVHSESSLETFTIETGITRMYDYDLSEEQLKNVSKFGQNVYKIKMTKNSGVTITASRANLVADPFWTQFQMGYGGYVVSDVAGDGTAWDFYTHPNRYFVNNAGVNGTAYKDAQSFIDGMYRFYGKEKWTAKLDAWQSV